MGHYNTQISDVVIYNIYVHVCIIINICTLLNIQDISLFLSAILVYVNFKISRHSSFALLTYKIFFFLYKLLFFNETIVLIKKKF